MAKVMKKVSPTRRLTYDVRELGKWWVIEMLPHIHKSSPYIHNIHVLKMEKISIVAEKECFASKNLVQYHTAPPNHHNIDDFSSRNNQHWYYG